MAQPQIAEAARAASALKMGALHLYFPTKPAALLDAAMELTNAYARYEAEQVEENRKNR